MSAHQGSVPSDVTLGLDDMCCTQALLRTPKAPSQAYTGAEQWRASLPATSRRASQKKRCSCTSGCLARRSPKLRSILWLLLSTYLAARLSEHSPAHRTGLLRQNTGRMGSMDGLFLQLASPRYLLLHASSNPVVSIVNSSVKCSHMSYFCTYAVKELGPGYSWRPKVSGAASQSEHLSPATAPFVRIVPDICLVLVQIPLTEHSFCRRPSNSCRLQSRRLRQLALRHLTGKLHSTAGAWAASFGSLVPRIMKQPRKHGCALLLSRALVRCVIGSLSPLCMLHDPSKVRPYLSDMHESALPLMRANTASSHHTCLRSNFK